MITVVLTSCNRPMLLEKTIDSFLEYNTYPIQKFIIIEDSGLKPNEHLKEKYHNITWIDNETNLGQAASIDKAYSLVETPYIFHCEDDWQFYRSGFIEKSIEILENNQNILQVWLRAENDCNGHPFEIINGNKLAVLNHKNIWHGFSFNPGVRRLLDYKKISPYSNFANENTSYATVEAKIGEAYKNLGYRVMLLDSVGFVKHIGEGHHIPRNLREQPQKVCFIIPYRDRRSHMNTFVPHLNSFLRKQGLNNYGLLFVEQENGKPFNRGKLLNIGFLEMKDKYDYFVFHDVDMLPITADYTYSMQPCHIATQCSQFGYKMPYPDYFGGVTIFNKQSFEDINGFSNDFWGWGAEDDELRERVNKSGLQILRRECRFKSLAHSRDFSHFDTNNKKLETAKNGEKDFSKDGLNTCEYKVINRVGNLIKVSI